MGSQQAKGLEESEEEIVPSPGILEGEGAWVHRFTECGVGNGKRSGRSLYGKKREY